MATVLEECTIEEQLSVARFFLWAKGLNAKDIHKEISPVYVGKCVSHKAVHSWVEKRDKNFADNNKVETEVRKWLRQQSKGLYATCLDALLMQLGGCISVCGEE
jgi:hypothetical protein